MGAIEISSPSLFTRYSSDPSSVVRSSLSTEDVGTIIDGQLYVLGRADDLYKVGGRAVFAHEIEGAVDQVAAVRPGSAVAVLDGDAGLVVIVEEATPGSGVGAGRAVRGAVLSTCGVALEQLVMCRPGSVRKTSSGKKQRAATLNAVREGLVDVVGVNA